MRAVVGLLPDLDRLDLIAVLGLRALVLAARELVRVDHEPLLVPESDRVAVVERIAVGFRHVVAAVGVDAADVVDHLVDQIRLIGRRHELAKERLREPARMTRRRAIAERVELDAALDAVELVEQALLVLGRELRGRQTIPALIGIEIEEHRNAARVDAGPIRQLGRRELLAAVRLLPERFIQVRRRAMLAPELRHLRFGCGQADGREHGRRERRRTAQSHGESGTDSDIQRTAKRRAHSNLPHEAKRGEHHAKP